MRHEDDSDMKIAGDDFDDILEPQGESAEAVAACSSRRRRTAI